MTVIRVDHGAGGWQAIPRAMLEDERISLAARGLMGWFLAKNETWRVQPDFCQKLFKLTSEKWGKLTGELIRAGYYHRVTTRDEKGRLRTSITITPVSTIPPGAGLPAHGQRATQSTTQSVNREPGRPGGLLKTKEDKTSEVKTLLKTPAPEAPNTRDTPSARVFNEIEISTAAIEKGLITQTEAARLKGLASREKNGQQLLDELVEQLSIQGRHPNGQISDPFGYFMRLKTSTRLTRSSEGESRRVKSTSMMSIGQILALREARNVR